MNNDNIYPTSYELGLVKGFITYLAYRDIPGVTFASNTDRIVFDAFIKRELARIDTEVARYSKTGTVVS